MKIDISKIYESFSNSLQDIIVKLLKSNEFSVHIDEWKTYLSVNRPDLNEESYKLFFEIFGIYLEDYPFKDYKDIHLNDEHAHNPFAIAVLSMGSIFDRMPHLHALDIFDRIQSVVETATLFNLIDDTNIKRMVEHINWNNLAVQFFKISKTSDFFPKALQLLNNMQEYFFLKFQFIPYHNVRPTNFWKLLDYGLKLNNNFYSSFLENTNVLFYATDEFIIPVKEYLDSGQISQVIQQHVSSIEGRNNIVDFLENVKRNKALNVLFRLN